jgi:hypothetical protein
MHQLPAGITISENAKLEPPAPGAEPFDPQLVLRALSDRWRGAVTLEYRSFAVADHIQERRVEVRTHARLRRPDKGRMVYLANYSEFSRLRVCNGRRVTDRMAPTPLRAGYTRNSGFIGKLTADLTHPVEFLSYSTDQFFAPIPFYPLPTWGDLNAELEVSAVRYPVTDPKTGQKRRRIRLTFTRGWARDTLILDSLSYSPIELVRIGIHGPYLQELMRENFEKVILGPSLPDSLFVWTPEDESGRVLR